MFQETVGVVTSHLESAQHLLDCRIPFLSLLAAAALLLLTSLLAILPLRVIILAWGVNKLTKKLIRPWSQSSNELLDFLSRVPDTLQLVSWCSSSAG